MRLHLAVPASVVVALAVMTLGSGPAHAGGSHGTVAITDSSLIGSTQGTNKAGSPPAVRNETATLRVSGSSYSEGTIASSPSGINCGFTCSATFNRGSTITLNASPKPGYSFDRWSGCSSSSGTTCTVTLSTYSSSKTVYAYFDEYPTLRVSKSPSSGGTVTATGLNCGYSCSVDAAPNSSIALTANASAGYYFDRWSGCSRTSGNSCTVNMLTSDKTVYAYFKRNPTLRVSKSLSSGGTVTSSGLNCGYSCSVDVAPNSSIVLTANAKAGYYFDRWSGCSRTSGNSCTVNMLTSDKTVYAYFKRNPTLRVSKSPSVGGRVTGSGIDCGFRCTVDVPPNSEVVLTASPSARYSFRRWSGCTRTSGNTCTVRVSSSNKTVTASFERNR